MDFYFFKQFGSLHGGHPIVGQDHRDGTLRIDGHQGIFHLIGGQHLIIFLGQNFFGDGEDFFLIIDDHYI